MSSGSKETVSLNSGIPAADESADLTLALWEREELGYNGAKVIPLTSVLSQRERKQDSGSFCGVQRRLSLKAEI